MEILKSLRMLAILSLVFISNYFMKLGYNILAIIVHIVFLYGFIRYKPENKYKIIDTLDVAVIMSSVLFIVVTIYRMIF